MRTYLARHIIHKDLIQTILIHCFDEYILPFELDLVFFINFGLVEGAVSLDDWRSWVQENPP